MDFKIVCLSFILLEFLCSVYAECEIKRVPRSNDDSKEKAKFYLECPYGDDPMLSMPSENEPAFRNSKLSNLLRSEEYAKKPVLKKPIFPKKPLNFDKYNLPNLRANDLFPPPEDLKLKPEIPKLNLDDLVKLRSPLTNKINEFSLPKLNNLAQEPMDLVDDLVKLRSPLTNKINELSLPKLNNLAQEPMDLVDDLVKLRSPLTNKINELSLPKLNNLAQEPMDLVEDLRNIFDKPPHGRFSNSLKDILARRNLDLNQSPSDVFENEEPEPFEDELTPQEPTLAEKLQTIAENHRKALEEAFNDAKEKLKIGSKHGDLDARASNNKILSQELPEENMGLKNDLSEKAKLLKSKIANRFKPDIERKKPLLTLPNDNIPAVRNDDGISNVEPMSAADRLGAFVEKTKKIARKVKKLVDSDIDVDPRNVDELRKANQQAQKIPSLEKISPREVEPEIQETPAEKLKKLLDESKRKAESILAKARKAEDPEISASNPKAILDPLPDKISDTKAKVVERVQQIAGKIKDAIDKAALDANRRALADRDSSVDASNLEGIVQEAPIENSDMEQRSSDGAADGDDDVIDLTEEGSKTANICKCIRVAFPEKFENGHFVMRSTNGDPEESLDVLEDEKPLIPKINRIPSSSILGNKLRNAFRTKGSDLAISANEMNPVFAAPPEGMGESVSGVHKAKLADQGVRSLLEFVKIVDQVDQYITTKARRAISRLATVLTEDEDARLL